MTSNSGFASGLQGNTNAAPSVNPASGFRIQSTGSSGMRKTIFPTRRITRVKGKPETETITFHLSPADLQRRFLLSLSNGPDGAPRASSATISLNGKIIAKPDAFNQNVSGWSLQLKDLQLNNVLHIKLASALGAVVEVSLTGFMDPVNIEGAVHSLIPEDDIGLIRTLPHMPGKVGLKFLETMQVKLEEQPDGSQKLVDHSGISLAPLETLLQELGNPSIHRAIGGDYDEQDADEAKAEALFGTDVPNQNLFYYLQFDANTDVWPIIDKIRQLPFIEESGPEFDHFPAATGTPTDPELTGSDSYTDSKGNKISFEKSKWLKATRVMTDGSNLGAWDLTHGDKSIKTAVLDYGAQHASLFPSGFGIATHEDFGANFETHSNINWGSTASYSDLGHHTKAAGIIGAQANNGKGIAGIASDGTTMIVQSFAQGIPSACKGGSSPCDAGADTITYARKQGAKVIIFEGWDDPWTYEHTNGAIRAAVVAAVANGVVVIIPAGNDTCSTKFDSKIKPPAPQPVAYTDCMNKYVNGQFIPGNNLTWLEKPSGTGTSPILVPMPDTGSIVVGGLKLDGSDKQPNYNYGKSLPQGMFTSGGHGTDVSAVAEPVVWTTGFDGNVTTVNKYSNFGGTSAAAPTVGATAALMLSQDPQLTPLKIREILRRTADQNLPYIAGMVNAYKAVKEVSPKKTCAPKPTEMVSWWPGEGNANDIADGNPGTLINGMSYDTGKVGQAFRFNGTDGYIRMADQPNLDFTTKMSIEAWIQADNLTTDQTLVSKHRCTSGQPGYVFLLRKSPFDKDEDGIISGLRLEAQVPIKDITSCNAVFGQIQTSIPVIKDNLFHHIAVSYEGTASPPTVKLYVDGVAYPTVTLAQIPAEINTNTQPFHLGTYINLAGQPTIFFQGRMDEVSVYNRALPQSEIAAISDAGELGKCK